MTRRPCTFLALGLTALLLLGCGEKAKKLEDMTKAERAAAVPFAGRDEKAVLSAFPDDARDILEQASSVTLFTLNPHRLVDGVLSPEPERFHNYGVLGKAEVTDVGEHRRLVEAVYEGLLAEGAGPAQCFIPRHGVRFVLGSQSVDVVICFQCTWVHVFRDGAKHETRLLFSAGVKPVFDSLVQAHALKQDGAPK